VSQLTHSVITLEALAVLGQLPRRFSKGAITPLIRLRKQWGITKLYNEYFHEPTNQLFKLHAKLDQLVLQAYGFNSDDDLLEKLLTLNLELAEKEKRREPVVGPWALKSSED
jgi:hypothetical protein